MRIPCPFCGERDAQEFAYHGDATLSRPELPDTDPADAAAFADYVYLRDNPAGRHRELWYHGAGCRAWLEVDRDTRSHAVHGAVLAAERSR
jgi:sarcosine oxidase subunit delta